MFSNKITLCPVCNNRIPIFYHLLYKETAGLECPHCHSLLGHTGKVITLKIGAMALFVVLLVIALNSKSYNFIWWAGTLFSLYLLVMTQLTSDFKIRYNNKDNP